jgi:hypothetical protein
MLNKIISLTRDELNLINLGGLKGQSWLYMGAGDEHYRLLAYISTLFKGKTLLDIGTYKGDSAAALTYSGKNKVISFDLNDSLENVNPNVEYKIANILDYPDLVIKAPFILLDTFHEGDFEMEFIDFLNHINYKGLIIFDDIHLNDPMKKVYNSINKEKYDLTNIGHHTGTGLVIW